MKNRLNQPGGGGCHNLCHAASSGGPYAFLSCHSPCFIMAVGDARCYTTGIVFSDLQCFIIDIILFHKYFELHNFSLMLIKSIFAWFRYTLLNSISLYCKFSNRGACI